MGDAGVFASGSTILELKAGAVIDSTDPALRARRGQARERPNASGAEASPATIPGTEAAVEAKITGLPVTLVIADGRASDGQAKFVLGLGESSITDALSPRARCRRAPPRAPPRARSGKGSRRASPPTPHAAEPDRRARSQRSSTVAPFVPFLRNSTALAGGGKSLGGGVQRLRLVLGLQPPTSRAEAYAGAGSGFARAGRFSVSMITRQGRLVSR